MKLLVIAVVAAALTGCGTWYGMEARSGGDCPPYHPTCVEGLMIGSALSGDDTYFTLPWWTAPPLMLDIPVTAAGDTVMLPYDAIVTWRREDE